MNTKLLIATAALLLWGAGDHVSASLVVAINQHGSNDPVNVNQPRAWNFGITSAGAAYFAENGLTFDSALFNAKTHKNTDAPLVFTLYSGLGGNVVGNTELAQVVVPSSQFNQQYSGGLGRLFTFDPQLFTIGYYSVTLTTTAPDRPTTEYFLKQGKLELLNSDQTPLDSLYWIQDDGTGHATTTFNGTGSLTGGGGGNVVLAPEASSAWAIAGLLLVSFGGVLQRRLQRKTAVVGA